MFKIQVGDSFWNVCEAEYILATMPRDTPIEWRVGNPSIPALRSHGDHGVGMFRDSYLCLDVVTGRVEISPGQFVALQPYESEKWYIGRVPPTIGLQAFHGMSGDGI